MSNPLQNVVQWFDNAIGGTYNPAAGIYDTQIPLVTGTPITSPVNGIVIGNGWGGLYGPFGLTDWGGEVDILTNLVGYGQGVVVDIIHFDTIEPNLKPGDTVSAGQYLGTSGGQLSGGNWPVTNPPGKTYSTGPHIGVGVRSATGFTPAWDAASLVYQLRSGSVQSSVPTGYKTTSSGSSGTTSSKDACDAQYGPFDPRRYACYVSTGVGASGAGLNPSAWVPGVVGQVEQDITGYSIRAGLAIFGALFILIGVYIFFSEHPQEEHEEQQPVQAPQIVMPQAGEAGEAAEVAEVAAV